jgi:uncharacterized protein (DUF433 family)
MLTIPSTIDVPLRRLDDGSIRIGQTRVLLEIVIHAFQRGDTPESIVEDFPALRLDDVYAVLAYYLRHRSEVDEYLAQVGREANTIRQKIEASQETQHLRERLLKRLDRAD